VQFLVRQANVDVTLEALDALPGVKLLRPGSVLCTGERCEVQRAGRALYFDSHHLSLTGTALLEPMFDTIFVDQPVVRQTGMSRCAPLRSPEQVRDVDEDRQQPRPDPGTSALRRHDGARGPSPRGGAADVVTRPVTVVSRSACARA
jgi:hypothetical protein